MSGNSGRNSDGTFAIGNPGKPRGARHRATMAVIGLLDGEAEQLTRKAVEMALEGDVAALRLCLERVAPPKKDTPVQFTLPPMKCAGDAAVSSGIVLEAVASGELTPLEGTHVMGLIDSYRKTLEATEFETRLTALEARQ